MNIAATNYSCRKKTARKCSPRSGVVKGAGGPGGTIRGRAAPGGTIRGWAAPGGTIRRSAKFGPSFKTFGGGKYFEAGKNFLWEGEDYPEAGG